MSNRVLSLCGLLVACSGILPAQPSPGNLRALPTSTLTIRGSTTIGARWSCTSNAVIATALFKPGDHGMASDEVSAVAVTVPVWALRCQSAGMERAMRKAMRADGDSLSAIVGSFAPALVNGPAAANGHLEGVLTVAGVQRAVTLDFSTARMSDSVVAVRSKIPMGLSDFRITPPRVLFGAVRARDAITVEVDLHFMQPAGPIPRL